MFIQLFMTWQTILALAKVSQEIDIKIKPVKLFDFGNFDYERPMLR